MQQQQQQPTNHTTPAEYFNHAKLTASLEAKVQRWGLSLINVPKLVKAAKVQLSGFPLLPGPEISAFLANLAASYIGEHYQYNRLAAIITMDALYKTTYNHFSEYVQAHNDSFDPNFVKIVDRFSDRLNALIDPKYDYSCDYFGVKTLLNGYLIRNRCGMVVERPQYMYLRVAVAMYMDTTFNVRGVRVVADQWEKLKSVFTLLSEGKLSHASPTLFSCGRSRQQVASCFLLPISEDSIDGIYSTLHECATISQYGGGIGLNVSKVRATDSPILSSGGRSSGVMPMLQVFNSTARYVNQGGRRPGAVAVYMEPWHADIFAFVAMRKNTGSEEDHCLDLFPALWIPDLFMQRVRDNEKWSLMCPAECPYLNELYGSDFETLYTRYESESRYVTQVDAQDLWRHITQAQIETGTPFIMYKDAVNRASSHQNIGCITHSNLCSEIMEFSSPTQTAVCNLASIPVNRFIITTTTTDNTETHQFDFQSFGNVVRLAVSNLNRLIDINSYPSEKACKSNKALRPIGIGIQGLADLFMKLRLPYGSQQALELNALIYEHLYYTALDESCRMSYETGETYDGFHGSPFASGKLNFDLMKPSEDFPIKLTLEWQELKKKIARVGLLNSLCVAQMPTASTANILGNSESFEPYTANIFTRRVLAGEYHLINKQMVDDLMALGLWSHDMYMEILNAYGSIQGIDSIPADLKALYKTAWEISPRTQMNMAITRSPFIDQSQSLTLFIEHPTQQMLNTTHFYGWTNGLKTGMYYLRTRPTANPTQITIRNKKHLIAAVPVCESDGMECTSCSA